MAKTAPALLQLCELSAALDALTRDTIRSTRQARQIVAALKDLAMSTIAIRRACRVRARDAAEFDYLYHYTGFGTFDKLFPVPSDPRAMGPFPNPRLVLSPTELLNDPNEGTHFFENLLGPDRRQIEPLMVAVLSYRRKMRVEIGLTDATPLVFTASLCVEHDNLNLWRFYGDAKGVSFGIHLSQFDCEGEEGIGDDYKTDKLYRVKYGDHEVRDALNHAFPALTQLNRIYCGRELIVPLQDHIKRTVTAILSTVAYLFKTDSYSAEKECRLLRILGVAEVRQRADVRTIANFIRLESGVELIHDSTPKPPILTLAPQFDGLNPERGQMWAVDRMSAALLPGRKPVVKLSAMKHRL